MPITLGECLQEMFATSCLTQWIVWMNCIFLFPPSHQTECNIEVLCVSNWIYSEASDSSKTLCFFFYSYFTRCELLFLLSEIEENNVLKSPALTTRESERYIEWHLHVSRSLPLWYKDYNLSTIYSLMRNTRRWHSDRIQKIQCRWVESEFQGHQWNNSNSSILSLSHFTRCFTLCVLQQ